MLALGFVFNPSSANAASITVNTDLNPSPCTLDEAIENINDQADTNTDCVETGAYGTDDTINIPEGAVVTSSNLPQISEPLIIEGAGIGKSVVDGSGVNRIFSINEAENVTFKGFSLKGYLQEAIDSDNTNIVISQLEVDGTGSDEDRVISIDFYSNDSDSTVSVSDIFMHNVSFSDSAPGDMLELLIISNNSDRGTTNIELNNSTFSDIISASSVNVVDIYSASGNSAINAAVNNLTISNVTAANSLNAFITLAHAFGSNSTNNTSLTNATFTNLQGSDSVYGGSGAFTGGGIAYQPDDVATTNLTITNALISGNKFTADSSCGFIDASFVAGGTGTVNGAATSLGGNIADDNLCATTLTHPTDQNNVGNLSSTLGTLSDNGGFVPTIPLLENSPAVDAGVDVSGLTTDARLSVRPQGNAFDSGAYESPFTREEESDESLANTGQNRTVFVTLAVTILSIASLMVLKQRSQKF